MKDYLLILNEIKQKVQQTQVKAVIAANKHMLFLYWEMGNYIIRHQHEEGWGSKIISLLATDLKKEFPSIKGFSARNLQYMKQFAAAYPLAMLQRFNKLEESLNGGTTFSMELSDKFLLIDNQCFEITQQPAAQLAEDQFLQSVIAKVTWSHHMILLDKLTLPGQRFWYMLNTIEHGNSRNVLAIQIQSNLFERQVTAKKITNFSRTLPEPATDLANYIMKDPYIFDFVQAKEKADERNI